MHAFIAFASVMAILDAYAVEDEKIRRFQSLTLDGQVKDTEYFLRKVTVRLSKQRLCLILFGDPSDPAVSRARESATDTLKHMADMGHNMALLHVDSNIYSQAPRTLLEDDDFVSPSFLIYVDGLQMSYHPVISDEEIRNIKSAMVIYESRFMGWLDKALEHKPIQKALVK